ncbi:formylglycine-generating enzyme family protein [Celeribacter halophilus]|uniref:formylglycine-generating enzyme family protein n=1 Tax=Celeribacter halophilus TaxID=576117 RepID=UPI002FCF7116
MTAQPEHGCCHGTTRTEAASAPVAPVKKNAASAGLKQKITALLRPIPGGIFNMGTNQPRYSADLDSPARHVRVSPFMLGATQITNEIFAGFVTESSYQTVAEREGWSFVFHMFAPDEGAGFAGPVDAPWWRAVPGACWRHPEGPESGLASREDHPVLHVSWEDAVAFCDFCGVRLPTEAEWEFAARGGLQNALFPWGDDPHPEGKHMHNIWQGRFPTENTGEDGFVGVASAQSFAPNGYGLYNMTGNVWDWCADWFGALPTATMPPITDPTGPSQGPGRVMRGGSHLCHASYCQRYFVHSRTHNTPDSSTGHIGFRVAAQTGGLE